MKCNSVGFQLFLFLQREDFTMDKTIDLITNNLEESLKLWERYGIDMGYEKKKIKKIKMHMRLMLGENI